MSETVAPTPALTPVTAGEQASGHPCPSAAEMEQHLVFTARLRSYLVAAAKAWVGTHGLPHGQPVHDQMDIDLDPDWPHEFLTTTVVGFAYFPDWQSWRSGSRRYLTIPTEDLLPEYGRALAVLAALASPARS